MCGASAMVHPVTATRDLSAPGIFSSLRRASAQNTLTSHVAANQDRRQAGPSLRNDLMSPNVMARAHQDRNLLGSLEHASQPSTQNLEGIGQEECSRRRKREGTPTGRSTPDLCSSSISAPLSLQIPSPFVSRLAILWIHSSRRFTITLSIRPNILGSPAPFTIISSA